jgi:hypothetical protein
MIFVFVSFKPRASRSPDEMRAVLRATAPKYRQIPGLIRKYFIGSPESGRAGGAYEWETLEQAKAYHDEAWRRMITETYGDDLRVEFFHQSAVADNDGGKIVYADGEVDSTDYRKSA